MASPGKRRVNERRTFSSKSIDSRCVWGNQTYKI